MVVIWADFSFGNVWDQQVAALEIVSGCFCTFFPPHSHVSDCIKKDLGFSLSENESDMILDFLNGRKLGCSQLLFQIRKYCEITRGEVRTVGGVGDQVDAIFSKESNGNVGSMGSGIVLMEPKDMVPLLIPLPQPWPFPSDSFFEVYQNSAIVVGVDRLPPRQKLDQQHTISVMEQCHHCLSHWVGFHHLLRALPTLFCPLTWLKFGLLVVQGNPSFVTRHYPVEIPWTGSHILQVLSTQIQSHGLVLIGQEMGDEFCRQFLEFQVLLQDLENSGWRTSHFSSKFLDGFPPVGLQCISDVVNTCEACSGPASSGIILWGHPALQKSLVPKLHLRIRQCIVPVHVLQRSPNFCRIASRLGQELNVHPLLFTSRHLLTPAHSNHHAQQGKSPRIHAKIRKNTTKFCLTNSTDNN